MGMYPPGEAPLAEEDLPASQRLNMRIENTPDTIMHSSPHKAERRSVKNNSKSGNRNLQAKRLSSQTIIQRSSQGGHGQGSQANAVISSHHPY